jgi:hypothetical protein
MPARRHALSKAVLTSLIGLSLYRKTCGVSSRRSCHNWVTPDTRQGSWGRCGFRRSLVLRKVNSGRCIYTSSLTQVFLPGGFPSIQVLTSMVATRRLVHELPGTAVLLKRKGDGMMLARHSRHDEFLNLQRTVDALSEQLRDVQLELQHKNEAFWKSLGFRKPASEFMSAVCNRRIRPNTKATG